MTLLDSDLQKMRVSYQNGELDEAQALANPLDQFKVWFEEATKAGCDEPNAFTLSTVDHNHPRARVVLLKGFHLEGPVFYSNYLSPKGHELMANAAASASFLWLPLQRQVRIEGITVKVPEEMSDDYFSKRPYGSQIAAIASPQGKVVSSRQELELGFNTVKAAFPEGVPVPRPKTWGGYAIVPTRWEFWQGRPNRLHDRVIYMKEAEGWSKKRLAP